MHMFGFSDEKNWCLEVFECGTLTSEYKNLNFLAVKTKICFLGNHFCGLFILQPVGLNHLDNQFSSWLWFLLLLYHCPF